MKDERGHTKKVSDIGARNTDETNVPPDGANRCFSYGMIQKAVRNSLKNPHLAQTGRKILIGDKVKASACKSLLF